MNKSKHWITGLLVGLGLILLLAPHTGRAVDETFDLVETKTGVYSNVTVTTKSKDYIVIQHARGMTSLKVKELSPELHEALGYGAVKGARKNSFQITAKAKALVNTISSKEIEQAWSKYSPAGTPALKLNPTIILAVLGGLFLSYLFFCYCGLLICRKVGKPAGWVMWVPVFQFIPLLRAANMSPLWLLGMCVPLLNIVAHFLWSFRIAGARGQGFWTAVFLILPTYPLAFVYLAFAGGASAAQENSPPEKFRPTSMVFDQS